MGAPGADGRIGTVLSGVFFARSSDLLCVNRKLSGSPDLQPKLVGRYADEITRVADADHEEHAFPDATNCQWEGDGIENRRACETRPDNRCDEVCEERC